MDAERQVCMSDHRQYGDEGKHRVKCAVLLNIEGFLLRHGTWGKVKNRHGTGKK